MRLELGSYVSLQRPSIIAHIILYLTVGLCHRYTSNICDSSPWFDCPSNTWGGYSDPVFSNFLFTFPDPDVFHSDLLVIIFNMCSFFMVTRRELRPYVAVRAGRITYVIYNYGFRWEEPCGSKHFPNLSAFKFVTQVILTY